MLINGYFPEWIFRACCDGVLADMRTGDDVPFDDEPITAHSDVLFSNLGNLNFNKACNDKSNFSSYNSARGMKTRRVKRSRTTVNALGASSRDIVLDDSSLTDRLCH